VFDLFVQERQAIDRSQGGLGLGLTIVRNLVERHRGTVSAHSDGPDAGSEFVVRLPRVHVAVEEARHLESASPPVAVDDGAALRILVVDDSTDGAEMLAAALTTKGYETRVAFDGPQALRIAAEFHPAIIFVDIGLPVMDGYELATCLRALPELSGIRLFALTGYGQESDRQRTREAGFDHHFTKPIALDAIESVLGPFRSHG
jgi:CheY-like chemotaxis protein